MHRLLVLIGAVVAFSLNVSVALADCSYGGQTYSEGSTICQSGTLMVCQEKSWRHAGGGCSVDFSSLGKDIGEVLRKHGLTEDNIGQMELILPSDDSASSTAQPHSTNKMPTMSSLSNSKSAPKASATKVCLKCKKFLWHCKIVSCR